MNGDKMIIFPFETEEKEQQSTHRPHPLFKNVITVFQWSSKIVSPNSYMPRWTKRVVAEKRTSNTYRQTWKCSGTGEQIRCWRQHSSASSFTTFPIEFVITKFSWAIFSCFSSPPSAAHRKEGTWTTFRREVHIVTSHLHVFNEFTENDRLAQGVPTPNVTTACIWEAIKIVRLALPISHARAYLRRFACSANKFLC